MLAQTLASGPGQHLFPPSRQTAQLAAAQRAEATLAAGTEAVSLSSMGSSDFPGILPGQ